MQITNTYVSKTNSKTVLELLAHLKLINKISKPDCQNVENNGGGFGQKIRSRIFEARDQRIDRGAMVKNRSNTCCVRKPGECHQWKANGQCTQTTSKVYVQYHRVISGILPNISVARNHRDADSMTNVLSCISKLKVNQQKSRKGMEIIVLCFQFQGTNSPKTSLISRKGTKVLRPTRSVKFSQNT